MRANRSPSIEVDAAVPGEALVRIAALTARLLSVPIVVVTIQPDHDPERWPESRLGLSSTMVAYVAPGVGAAPSDVKALQSAEQAADVLGLEFHASTELLSKAGQPLGTLSILDRRTRTIRPAEQGLLHDLAAVIVDEIDIWLAATRSRDLDRATVRLQQQSLDDIAVLTAAMREVTAYEHPAAVRPAICRIALSLTGAESAALYEIAEDDDALVRTVTVGTPWPESVAALGDRSQAPVRAFVGGKPVLVTGDESRTVAHGGRVDPPMVAFWQPFAAGGPTSAAVIGLIWRDIADLAPVRLTRLMETFAAEAMRAIERAELLLRLEDLARTDELTQLPNRRALDEALTQELQRARRDDHPLCVAMLDLDRFKRYNDTAGHAAGDRLLADTAARWREVLRDGTDILARYGGEEFVVVLPAGIDIAHATLERMRATTPSRQTASVGLAEWDQSEPGAALLARADAALYAAKANGRDRIERAPRPVAVRHTA